MGINSSKVKINNNQVGIPDIVLRRIIYFVNCNTYQNTLVNSQYNVLSYSLVCSYWLIHIIPQAVNSLLLYTKSNVLHTYPKQLTKYIKYQQQSLRKKNKSLSSSLSTSTTTNKSKELPPTTVQLSIEKLEIIFDAIRRPQYTLWTMFYREENPNTKENRNWLQKNTHAILNHYPNLKTLRIHRMQLRSIHIESLIAAIPTLTKLCIFPSNETNQFTASISHLLFKCPNIIKFTYLQKAGEFPTDIILPSHLHSLALTTKFTPTQPMENLKKLYLHNNGYHYKRIDNTLFLFDENHFHLLPNLEDLTLINTYAPIFGPFLFKATKLKRLCINGLGIRNEDEYGNNSPLAVKDVHSEEKNKSMCELLIDDLDTMSKSCQLVSLTLKRINFKAEALWPVLNRMDLERLSLDGANGYVIDLLPHLEMSIPTLKHLSLKARDIQWTSHLHSFLLNNDTLTSLSIECFTCEQSEYIVETINKNPGKKKNLQFLKLNHTQQSDLASNTITLRSPIYKHRKVDKKRRVTLTEQSFPPRRYNHFAM